MQVSFNGWYKIPNAYVVRRGAAKLGLNGILPNSFIKKGIVGTMHDPKTNSFYMLVKDDAQKVYEKFMKRIKVVPKKVADPFNK